MLEGRQVKATNIWLFVHNCLNWVMGNGGHYTIPSPSMKGIFYKKK